VWTRQEQRAPGGLTPVFSSRFLQHPKGRTQVNPHRALSQAPIPFIISFFFCSFSVAYIIGTKGYHLGKFIDATVYSEKVHALYYNPPSIHSFHSIFR
jgi:hypothetical protein